ncbi:alpha/beta fold hydrolase [Streptomyces sp. NBC_01456]|uniref:alpha/beta fold hydrolase n=1 Tax=unclassified Streptomyces TaxID=2593676 RepID=UPI003FCC5698
MWRPVIQAIGKDHPTAAPDLPGHGSRRGEPFSIAGAVAAVTDTIDELGGRALLVGLSLGGIVATARRETPWSPGASAPGTRRASSRPCARRTPSPRSPRTRARSGWSTVSATISAATNGTSSRPAATAGCSCCPGADTSPASPIRQPSPGWSAMPRRS